VLLTITTTREPATDLGFLLHKHPDRLQSFEVSAGVAHVFYPEASPARCTAALLLEVDPIALVRGRDAELTQYVNDRPYAASSMLAVAMKEAFRTALTGRCDARPDLARTPIPLELRVPALRCKGGAELVRRVFEPLGWAVDVRQMPLDPPEWGDSPYADLRLTGTIPLKDALNHLYVLLPVLDDAKHYWVSTDEIDKLIRAGGDWLAGHPEKTLIARRYLAHRRSLAESALARLAEAGEDLDNAIGADESAEDEVARKPLAVQRREAILAVLKGLRARTVGDFGCGGGALTRDLVSDKDIDLVVATDVSARALQLAARRLHLDHGSSDAGTSNAGKIRLFQSALTYRDDRLTGLDAAVLMEVIEHVDADRLPALERAVFGFAAPSAVVVTTPNSEYNVLYPDLKGMRHPDHRFEWTRAEFGVWAGRVCAGYGYRAEFRGVGDEDPDRGAPTQLAVFTKETV
jgi:3' terminal RNA ribose 2'-O-methyltransferase Hen1